MTILSDLPYGFSCGHLWHEIGTLLRFINQRQPTLFVELGVHVGGLASVLSPRTLHHPTFRYVALENNGSIVRDSVKQALAFLPNCRLLVADCFTVATRTAVEAEMKSRPGPALIYCDNGNKPKELLHYAPICRPGDLLGVHDYWEPGREVVGLPGYGTDPNTWTPEVRDTDIWPVLEQGFIRVDEGTFTGARIVMMQKVP
jgi:hypothetical protein